MFAKRTEAKEHGGSCRNILLGASLLTDRGQQVMEATVANSQLVARITAQSKPTSESPEDDKCIHARGRDPPATATWMIGVHLDNASGPWSATISSKLNKTKCNKK